MMCQTGGRRRGRIAVFIPTYNEAEIARDRLQILYEDDGVIQAETRCHMMLRRQQRITGEPRASMYPGGGRGSSRSANVTAGARIGCRRAVRRRRSDQGGGPRHRLQHGKDVRRSPVRTAGGRSEKESERA